MARKREFDPEEALDKAMHVFWEKGYAGTSMRDLTAATGVAPAGLYAAFGDKDSLYQKSLEHYRDNYIGRLLAELFTDEAGLDEIRVVFTRIHDRQQTFRRGVGCLWTNGAMEFGDTQPDKSDLFRWNAVRMEDAFARALSRSVEAGKWPADRSIDQTAALLVSIFNGFLVLGRGSAEPHIMDRSLKAVFALLES